MITNDDSATTDNDSMRDLLEEFGSKDDIRAANRERDAYEYEPEDTGELVKDYPAPQREIDLHGMTVPEALREIDYFIDHSIKQRVRTVRLITGKGLHSVNFKPVLPGETEKRLAELRREGKILSFRREKNAGSFAVYLVS